jgi:hypothetical protein
MPTHDDLLEALRGRLLEAISSTTTTSDSVLTLSEAYAWLRAPDAAHGSRRDH